MEPNLLKFPQRFLLQKYLLNIAMQPTVRCYNLWADICCLVCLPLGENRCEIRLLCVITLPVRTICLRKPMVWEPNNIFNDWKYCSVLRPWAFSEGDVENYCSVTMCHIKILCRVGEINSLIQGLRRHLLKTTTSKTHYCDVIMGTIASQITSLTIVYSTVYSGTD